MAGNPLIPVGTLNRLRGSLLFPDNTNYNITSSFLGKSGLTWTPEGETTAMLETMTGVVTSQAPYQLCNMSVALVKSQSFADIFKQRIQTNAQLGTAIFRSDAKPLSPWTVLNVSIQNVGSIKSDGLDPDFPLTLKGYWPINSALWNF